jgi:hypothetical protein
MRNSNLAECLEEFEAAEDARKVEALRVAELAVADVERRAPRRPSFNFRRIRIRDPGLPRFRVF